VGCSCRAWYEGRTGARLQGSAGRRLSSVPSPLADLLPELDDAGRFADAAELRDVAAEHQGEAARVERLKNKPSTTMTKAIPDACLS
jgi:hypothetical protein